MGAMIKEKKESCDKKSTATTTTTTASEDGLTLTAAGWCEKCKGKWDKGDCKDKKEEKKESCDKKIIAGWCDKCDGKWDEGDCKDMKKKKKDSCDKKSTVTTSDDGSVAVRDFNFKFPAISHVQVRTRGLRGAN